MYLYVYTHSTLLNQIIHITPLHFLVGQTATPSREATGKTPSRGVPLKYLASCPEVGNHRGKW